MGDRRSAGAALGADEGDDLADRLGSGAGVETGNRADEIEYRERRDEIFADAARHQLAIEHDVVHAAGHDDLGSGIAKFGERVR